MPICSALPERIGSGRYTLVAYEDGVYEMIRTKLQKCSSHYREQKKVQNRRDKKIGLNGLKY